MPAKIQLVGKLGGSWAGTQHGALYSKQTIEANECDMPAFCCSFSDMASEVKSGRGAPTCSADLSGLRLESEGRGFRPLPLISMRAKLLKPYLSASAGLSEHCRCPKPVSAAACNCEWSWHASMGTRQGTAATACLRRNMGPVNSVLGQLNSIRQPPLLLLLSEHLGVQGCYPM